MKIWKVCFTMCLLVAAFRIGAAQDQGHVPGRLLVKFRNGVSQEKALQVLQKHGATNVILIGSNIYFVGVPAVNVPFHTNEEMMEKALNTEADVESAELDKIMATGSPMQPPPCVPTVFGERK